MMEHSTAYSSIALRMVSGFLSMSARARVHHADRAVDHRLAGVDADRHLRQLLANQAEVRDALAESLALFGIGNRILQRSARAADAARAQLEAAYVQNVERDDVAFADLAEHVLHRHLAIVQDERRGGRAADAHLLFFRADGEAREIFLDQERGELLAIDFGEDGEQVGEVGVGDPHLFAVQDVVLAVGRKHGAGAAVHRVGAAGAFRKRVGADHFGRSQLGQIFLLLLLGAEEDDRQRADAGVSAHRHHEAAALGHVVGDDGRRDFVHLRAAVLGRHVGVGQAHLAGLLQQLASDGPVLVLDFFDLRQDFVDRELLRQLRDHLVIFVKVFRSEDVVEVVIFEQKTSARGFRFGSCRRGCHRSFLLALSWLLATEHLAIRNQFHHRLSIPELKL